MFMFSIFLLLKLKFLFLNLIRNSENPYLRNTHSFQYSNRSTSHFLFVLNFWNEALNKIPVFTAALEFSTFSLHILERDFVFLKLLCQIGTYLEADVVTRNTFAVCVLLLRYLFQNILFVDTKVLKIKADFKIYQYSEKDVEIAKNISLVCWIRYFTFVSKYLKMFVIPIISKWKGKVHYRHFIIYFTFMCISVLITVEWNLHMVRKKNFRTMCSSFFRFINTPSHLKSFRQRLEKI